MVVVILAGGGAIIWSALNQPDSPGTNRAGSGSSSSHTPKARTPSTSPTPSPTPGATPATDPTPSASPSSDGSLDTMPRLAGQSYGSAVDTLEAGGLAVQGDNMGWLSDPASDWVVCSTDPPVGAALEAGQTVVVRAAYDGYGCPRPRIDRQSNGAVEFAADAGTHTVGQDLPEGRYVVTQTTDRYCDLQVSNVFDQRVLWQSLGSWGTPSVTLDLIYGDVLEIDDCSLEFTPAQTVLMTDLTAGQWVVGLDIEPGAYEVSCAEADCWGSVSTTPPGQTQSIIRWSLERRTGVASAKLYLEEDYLLEVDIATTLHFEPL